MRWKLAYAPHDDAVLTSLKTISEIEQSGFPMICASVPGSLELDLMNAGILDDPFFSTHLFDVQKLETLHVWYYTTLCVEDERQSLRFEGIDTFAEIYINGEMVSQTDNMFLSYDLHPRWKCGENEIVVHIRPAMLEARKYTPPAVCYAQKYNYAALYARKAAYMYGWDIMPRIVSAGIWKPVRLFDHKPNRICEVYSTVQNVDYQKKAATLTFYLNTRLEDPVVQHYAIRIEGVCGDSRYCVECQLWNHACSLDVSVQNCRLWWPKNAGMPELYEVTLTLLHKGEPCDVYRFRQGIRTLELVRTPKRGDEPCGTFCFRVNGKKIFVLGTNWVPLDAFPARHGARLSQALSLLDESGCNMVRCWGGGVYEDDAFYDFCDAHGILVWQDFMMGCAVYPDDAQFHANLEREAVFQIKRLRNHPSLALWAGDNECDEFRVNSGRGAPEENEATRRVLRRAVAQHDYSRPYLPSSPYIDAETFLDRASMPEKYLWGPRDYFRGGYYTGTFCRFASEMG